MFPRGEGIDDLLAHARELGEIGEGEGALGGGEFGLRSASRREASGIDVESPREVVEVVGVATHYVFVIGGSRCAAAESHVCAEGGGIGTAPREVDPGRGVAVRKTVRGGQNAWGFPECGRQRKIGRVGRNRGGPRSEGGVVAVKGLPGIGLLDEWAAFQGRIPEGGGGAHRLAIVGEIVESQSGVVGERVFSDGGGSLFHFVEEVGHDSLEGGLREGLTLLGGGFQGGALLGEVGTHQERNREEGEKRDHAEHDHQGGPGCKLAVMSCWVIMHYSRSWKGIRICLTRTWRRMALGKP